MKALIKNIWKAPAATMAGALVAGLTFVIGADIEIPKGVMVGLGAVAAVQYRANSGWVTYSGGATGSFTSSDERVFTQCGDEEKINLNLSGATSPDLDIVVTELR